MPLPAALAPFRIRSFRFQWPSDLLTSWAFEMEQLILGWYVLVETGSVVMLTIFGVLQFSGTLVAPMFGVAGDRLGHRNVLCCMRAAYTVLAAVLIVGTLLLFPQTKRLNALAIGEQSARRLGVDPNRLRWTVLVVGTAMAGTAVGTVGAIAFLGLVAPHIARRLMGVDWRWSLPGALAVGSGLMIAADVIAQRGLDLPR